MFPPIQALVRVNMPVKCANPNCSKSVVNQQEAMFVVKHILVIGYCCPFCYLEAWRTTLEYADRHGTREDILDHLGYYGE